MARGKYCPMCGSYMYALHEKETRRGTIVIYECRGGRCRFREKVFESR